MSSVVGKGALGRAALGKIQQQASALHAKATTILGKPEFNKYLAGANILLSIISFAVYYSSMGSYLTTTDILTKIIAFLLLSAIVYRTGPLLPLTLSKVVLVFTEVVLLISIGLWFTTGPSDKKAADNAKITDNLATQPDGTRCLSGTGTCDGSGKACVKKDGNTVKGDIVACGA
jgi:hypothetical protein